MGERKVLNKYYPPDFDPRKLPRGKKKKNSQKKLTNMLPMSIRCNTCGNYMYKGTKFNCRGEDCIGETYLGIKIVRFYFKCSLCCAELTMTTDPQNSDYKIEWGATRLFEPWRAVDETIVAQKASREAEKGDGMKALENRMLDSKREMDIMATLDELKYMKGRQAGVSTAMMLECLNREKREEKRLKDLVVDEEAKIRQEEKKRKRESIGREMGDKNRANLQSQNSLIEGIPETGDKGSPPERKAGPVKTPFAMRAIKPVTFSVKPKAAARPLRSVAFSVKPKASSAEGKTKSEVFNDDGGENEMAKNGNGKAKVPGAGLAALGLAYDGDSD